MANILTLGQWIYNNEVYTNFVLSWEETTSVANNTSTLSWSVTTSQTPTGSGYRRTLNSGSVNINGTAYNFTSGSVYNGLVVASGSTSITHLNDGTKTINVSMSANVGGASKTTSTSVALANIPRQSSISVASSYSVANTTGSLSYTITPQTAMYHKVIWSLNGTSTTEQKGAISASTSYTIANTSLLNAMSNTTNANITITLYTYTDSGYSNLIGTMAVSSAVTINTSSIKPTITFTSITYNNGTTLNNNLISGYTTAKANVTATNSSGSTGVTISYVTSHGTINSSGVTSTLPSSYSDYTLTITATATDSRGTKASATKTASVYGYKPPVATLNAYRTATNSSTSQDLAGSYMYVTSSTSVGSLSSIGNTITQVTTNRTYSSGTSSTFANGNWYNCATDESCLLTLTAKDSMGVTTTSTLSVQVASYPLDLYQDGNSIGVGLCTQAENDLIKCGKVVKMVQGQSVANIGGGTGGTNGYLKFATIKIRGTYCDQPITFNVIQRSYGIVVPVYLRFSGVDNTDPTLGQFQAIWYYDQLYIHKSTTSTWDLYIKKNGEWGNVTITSLETGDYWRARASITFSDTFVTSLPDGVVQATYRTIDYSSTSLKTLALDSSIVPSSGNWKGYPYIAADGVMEIGHVIDLHSASTTTDYTQRISADGTYLYTTGCIKANGKILAGCASAGALGTNIAPVYVSATGTLTKVYESTSEATITKSSGNCTFTYYWRNCMGMVFLSMSLKTTASISSGSNIFVGTLSGWKPNSSSKGATGGTYYSSVCQGGYINTSGTITIRACSTIPSGAEVIISFYYYS